jgi:hypothetical protein
MGMWGRTPWPKSRLPTTFLGGDIDDDEAGAVGAGLADAGVAVDGHVGEAAVG